MSALAGGVKLDTAKFRNVGDSVSGRIIDFQDVQERDFNEKDKFKWFTPDGKLAVAEEGQPGWTPVLQVRITLETRPGDSASRLNLFISGQRMKNAVRAAMSEAGVNDISPQSDISVTFTGYEGTAKLYSARYSAFDPTA